MRMMTKNNGEPVVKKVSVKSSSAWLHNQNVRHAGNLAQLDDVAEAAATGNVEVLARLLKAERECFGIIIEMSSFTIAATDRVCGYPIYLRQSDDCIEIATDTSDWVTDASEGKFNESRAKAFLASGYTLGSNTLFNNVRRLLPGEIVLINHNTGELTFSRYYVFQPDFYEKPDGQHGAKYWEDRLETVLNNAFTRVIERANGAKIWVPLSAGYDSRAVLAKLLALGYERIETFSYGTPGNMEARVAEELAEKAGVPWRFISSEPDNPRKEFRSDEVNNYFLFAGGLSSTPAMSEFFALRALKQSGALDDDDYVVNGQSGDFLTGGHFPKVEYFSDLALYCLNRHFALFESKKNDIGIKGMETILMDWIAQYLPKNRQKTDTPEQLVANYQSFEWQERQSQYVVQQQRAYDFLGINWALPLWDTELMDFFEEVPFEEQQDQALYIRYLSKWNFKGLFNEGRRPYNPWPKYGFLFRSLARFFALFLGKNGREKAYKALYYWTDLHCQYNFFGYKIYFTYRNKIKNPVALFMLRYLQLITKNTDNALGLQELENFEKEFGTR